MCRYIAAYMYSFFTFSASLSCINFEYFSILQTQELFKRTFELVHSNKDKESNSDGSRTTF
jgi:hypothetical protein